MSLFIQLTCAIAMFAVALPAAEVAQAQASVQGDWTLNRELTPAAPNGEDEARRPEGRRRPEGGFPPGGGGRRGRSGNGPGGARGGPSEKEMRKLRAVRSRIAEAPQRLVISIDGTRVQIVDEFGRSTNLVADGKKQERVTGDGEFKSVTRLDGPRLVVEEDFGGPKVTTTYERLTGEGEGRLQVTLKIDGMPEGPRDRGNQRAKEPITRIYDAGNH